MASASGAGSGIGGEGIDAAGHGAGLDPMRPWLRLVDAEGCDLLQLAAAEVATGEDVKVKGKLPRGIMPLTTFEALAMADLSEPVACLQAMDSRLHPAANSILFHTAYRSAIVRCTEARDSARMVESGSGAAAGAAAGAPARDIFEEEGIRQDLVSFLLLLARPARLLECIFFAQATVARESLADEYRTSGHGEVDAGIRELNASLQKGLGTIFAVLEFVKTEA